MGTSQNGFSTCDAVAAADAAEDDPELARCGPRHPEREVPAHDRGTVRRPQRRQVRARVEELENGPVAGCFEPRHALVYTRGDESVISLICFQCHYLVTLQAEPPESQKHVRQGFQDTTPSLRDDLNGILRDAGIKISD